mmetsp:Transcript_16726/g.50067  ORF Transcript_16726/g.50067 Transcript_16726/m.50067 type:complete len:298 (+) Transcript_16726:213-1106(+)
MAWASHRGEHNWRVGRAPRVVEVDARDAGADHGKRVVDVEEAGRVSVAGACQALHRQRIGLLQPKGNARLGGPPHPRPHPPLDQLQLVFSQKHGVVGVGGGRAVRVKMGGDHRCKTRKRLVLRVFFRLLVLPDGVVCHAWRGHDLGRAEVRHEERLQRKTVIGEVLEVAFLVVVARECGEVLLPEGVRVRLIADVDGHDGRGRDLPQRIPELLLRKLRVPHPQVQPEHVYGACAFVYAAHRLPLVVVQQVFQPVLLVAAPADHKRAGLVAAQQSDEADVLWRGDDMLGHGERLMRDA